MAISIHSANEVNQFLGKSVNNKNKKDSPGCKQYSHSENQNEDDAEQDQCKNKFSQGLKIFMDTTLPGKKVLSELTGIAEMDAVGLQFFIAMQRQFVRLRLAAMNDQGDEN